MSQKRTPKPEGPGHAGQVAASRTGSTSSVGNVILHNQSSTSVLLLDFSSHRLNASGETDTSIRIFSASEHHYAQPQGPLPLDQVKLPHDNPKIRTKFGDGIDVQEVACDTSDIPQFGCQRLFVMNFSEYGRDIEVFKTHIGLRRKLQPLGACSASPTTSDDYNREIIRYLKTQPNLHRLDLVLEISPDDDTFEYKFYKRANPYVHSGPKIPTSIYHIHVEMPGVNSAALPEWKYFLEQQTEIQTLICNFGVVHWEFYSPTILRNSRTLEKVVLRRIQSYDFEIRKQVAFDWSIFSDCQRLAYLKVTCGYKDRWAEWRMYGRRLPNETFFHTNFDTLPEESLTEFHVAKIVISKKELFGLIDKCDELEVVCPLCPDREFYDGDWDVSPGDFGDSFVESDLSEMSRFSRERDKNALISLLLILFGIGFTGLIALICIAVYFSR